MLISIGVVLFDFTFDAGISNSNL